MLDPLLPRARARAGVSFFYSSVYSSLPPRFVAPIINISQSPRLTARSAHRCCRCFFFFLILLFFFFLVRHPRPAHPAACIVPIINSNLCRTLFFILPSPPSSSPPYLHVVRIFCANNSPVPTRMWSRIHKDSMRTVLINGIRHTYFSFRCDLCKLISSIYLSLVPLLCVCTWEVKSRGNSNEHSPTAFYSTPRGVRTCAFLAYFKTFATSITYV